MWITLTETSGKKFAVNLDNIVQIKEAGEGSSRTTNLWTTTTNDNVSVVFKAREGLSEILAMIAARRPAQPSLASMGAGLAATQR